MIGFTSCKAQLVVGVKYKDLISVESKSTDVTKYNPDTGRPYQKTINTNVIKVAGRETDHPTDVAAIQEMKLEVFGTKPDRSDWIIGLVVHEAHVASVQVSDLELEITKRRLRNTLEAYGYTNATQLYLIRHLS